MGQKPSHLNNGSISFDDTDVIRTKDDVSISPEDFIKLKVIGKGSFGKVFLVKKKDSEEIFAMKVLHKAKVIEKQQVEHTRTEREVLQRIRHPFIVPLHYAFQTKEKLYMVMDYISGGELFFHLKNEVRFSEDRVRLYAAELVLVIEYLHSLNVIYRDLKPENILLGTDGHICLTDFGLSKAHVIGDKDASTFCGTPEYLAPEILKDSGHGKNVDWWSLGTLLYEMLTGLPPFYSQNQSLMYKRILHSELTFPHFLSSSAKSLLTGLLQRDVAKRLGTGENGASNIKNHRFFEGVDWDGLLKKEVKMPFIPVIKGADDVSNFDTCFTQELPTETPVDLEGLPSGHDQFSGFTYVNQESK
ncbi:hypothetical protein P9112_009629 [Eukaryota sp. TZLM1-RC]